MEKEMTNEEEMEFPVDDSTLMAVEHALGGMLQYDEETDDFNVIGADYSLYALLEFLSGVSEEDFEEVDDDDEYGIPVVICNKPIFHPDNVISALIKEIKRLRELVPEDDKEP